MNFDPREAMTIMLDDVLPEYPSFDPAYRRAPRREANLTQADKELAIRNALRYIPQQHHAQMAVEFAEELEQTGRIYGYRTAATRTMTTMFGFVTPRKTSWLWAPSAASCTRMPWAVCPSP